MLISPINSDELVNSVQRDYRQAAEAYRMAEQVSKRRDTGNHPRPGIALAALATIIIALGQLVAG